MVINLPAGLKMLQSSFFSCMDCWTHSLQVQIDAQTLALIYCGGSPNIFHSELLLFSKKYFEPLLQICLRYCVGYPLGKIFHGYCVGYPLGQVKWIGKCKSGVQVWQTWQISRPKSSFLLQFGRLLILIIVQHSFFCCKYLLKSSWEISSNSLERCLVGSNQDPGLGLMILRCSSRVEWSTSKVIFSWSTNRFNQRDKLLYDANRKEGRRFRIQSGSFSGGEYQGWGIDSAKVTQVMF